MFAFVFTRKVSIPRYFSLLVFFTYIRVALHLGRILPKNKRIIGVGLSDFLHGDTQPLPLFAPRVAVQVYEDIFPSFALFGYVFAKRGVVFYLGTL